jgi:putative membrane protein
LNFTIKTFINGMIFGIANIIPGVSGGTISVILNFFDDLINAINGFTKDYKKHLRFLIPLLFGAATGILVFSSIIEYMLEKHSFFTIMFFSGLIIGSIPFIYSKTNLEGKSKLNLKDIVIVAIPLLILIYISNLKDSTIINSSDKLNTIDIKYIIFIFFSGIIGASAMVIPGLSGSFILLLLGVYPLVTHSISSIRLLLTDFTDISLIVDICKVLVPLGFGIIIGILLITKLIATLLEKYYRTTYLVILGLVFGSIYALFNDQIAYKSGFSINIFLFSIISFAIGLTLSLIFGKE